MSNRIKTIKEFLEYNSQSKMWEETGFMEGLDSDDALVLIEKFEEMRKVLLSYSNVLVREIEVTIFCIIRRAFVTYKHMINDCVNTLNYVVSRKSLLLELCSAAYNRIDGEAEFTELMAQEITNLGL